jgi:Fe-S cluster assembly scaffold protein SufB
MKQGSTEQVLLSKLPEESRFEVPGDATLELLLPLTELVGDHSIEVVLTEPGASANIIAALVSDAGTGTLDIVTRHAAPNTSGSTLLRSVLGGTAEVSSKGLIRIESNAAKTVDFLEERFMLVSKGAKAQTDPQLEIETDDVKASHAASCGPVDPMQVFYLRSRGIPKAEAIRVLSEAFLMPALSKMPEDAQKKVLEKFQTLTV